LTTASSPPPPDSNIYLAIARKPDGGFETACESLVEIVVTSTEAGIDLGAPLTRPAAHPDYRDYYAAIEVHRSRSIQRSKAHKPPGPRASRQSNSRNARSV